MDWKKLSQKPMYDGWRKVSRATFQLPDGSTNDYDIVQAGQRACVLALTPENRVILTRQYRPGLERVLLELPGGAVDPGEEPLEAIRRELAEETGYSGTFEPSGNDFIDAYSTQHRHSFVATDCRLTETPQNNPHEPIEVVTMPLDEFRQHLRGGQLTDVATGYMGLEHLGLL